MAVFGYGSLLCPLPLPVPPCAGGYYYYYGRQGEDPALLPASSIAQYRLSLQEHVAAVQARLRSRMIVAPAPETMGDAAAPVVDPGAPVVDPGAPVVDPGAPVLDPAAPLVDPDAQ